MPRTLLALAVLACATAAAPAALAQKVPAANLPPAVVSSVRAVMPQMTIVQAERKSREGRVYFDVEGRQPDGAEIELDLLQTASGWDVVEIQRDIPWADTPAIARAAALKANPRVAPVRVIESKQMDGKIVYELFAAGRPETPAMEVLVENGVARVLTEAWPH
jgi:predicted lipoprotein